MNRIARHAIDYLLDAAFELFWNTEKAIGLLAATGLYALLSGEPLHHLTPVTIVIAAALVLDVTAWFLAREEYRRQEEAAQ